MKRSTVALGFCCFLGIFVVLSSGIGPPVFAQSSSSAQSKPPEYVGAETCKTCHEDIYNGWEKSPHWKQTLKEGGIAKHGCEDCHGAGAAHVADPADTSTLFLFEKASAKDINARCLTCHAGGPQHMNTINSEHAKNDVSCISCHSPHHAETKEFLLKKSQPALCYSCHLQQKAQFEMPFHHRVNEGLIQCSDCHKSARYGEAQAGAHFLHARLHLLQVPHRQAGAICLRTPARQDRWLPVLPSDPRRSQSSHAEAE